KDVLTVNQDLIEAENEDFVVTKKRLLAAAQKMFGATGFTAPTTLMSNLWLEDLWEKQISWDAAVDDKIAVAFTSWVFDLLRLLKFEIPRWISLGSKGVEEYLQNVRYPNKKRSGELIVAEIEVAGKFIFRTIQKENFVNLQNKNIKGLNPFYNKCGVIRLKSRVSNRDDTNNYRFPIVLLAKHPVSESLIKLAHVETQSLLCLLCAEYCILGGRRTIRPVLRKCVICRRFDAKPFVIEPPPLPVDRVRNTVAFKITGVDFSARRDRPKILYGDNGTNFRGSGNAFVDLDWDQITRETLSQHIVWRFNPSSASWWSGFFERLVGLMKQLLRRLHGNVCLYYEERMTFLWDCEAVVNSGPLAYISNDPNDVDAFTAAMLRDNLRQRFRLEYLGQLKLLFRNRNSDSVKLGDIGLIGIDNVKGVEWPIGRVVELIAGKDGCTRLVRVKTKRGQLLRPVQRLFPLECNGDAWEKDEKEVEFGMDSTFTNVQPEVLEKGEVSSEMVQEESARANVSARSDKSRAPVQKVSVTRSGRVLKVPKRLID
ncbi:hypothetical protein ILUMI_13033, partial [Ignelater luminosus]